MFCLIIENFMNEISKMPILVATDFGTQAMVALEYAVSLAEISKDEIILLHTAEENNFLMKFFESDYDKTQAEHKIRTLFEPLIAKYPSVKISSRIEYGKPYEKIVEVAEEIKPRFIVMGKTETSTLKKFFLGSNALHVIEASKFPVITIKGQHSLEEYRNLENEIILPLDLGKKVNEQIGAAIEYAKLFHFKVKIVSVLTSNSVGEEVQWLTKLNKAKKLIEEANVECDSQLIKNDDLPIHKIVIDFANQEKSRLIITMTQQENNFEDFFIGSTAQALICNSEIPILSVVPWNIEDTTSVFKPLYDPMGIL